MSLAAWDGAQSLVGFRWLQFSSTPTGSPAFLVLLTISILLNFSCSLLILKLKDQTNWKRLVLGLGIAVNLLLLGYYKYFFPLLNFLHDHGIGNKEWAGVLLPLGISFFTFTQIGYLVDLSQGSAERQSFIDYVLFVTFFPHLIAGPILHHGEIMPQFTMERHRVNTGDLAVGFTWFVMGLFKKVAIADVMAKTADPAFAAPGSLSFLHAWGGLLCYSLQLYFDFSGYSDMALGLARMFSIEFPLNFDSPYKAKNMAEYWQRWHMTLTRYLNLYLYNPISLWVTRRRVATGKKVSRKAAATPEGFLNMIAFPTMTTMFLAGIWHGAGLQFMVFGLLHAIYLTGHQAWVTFGKKKNAVPTRMGAVGAVAFTYLCATFSQVFFRSTSMHNALLMLQSLAGTHGLGLGQWSPFNLVTFAEMILLYIIVWSFPNTQQILGKWAHRNPEKQAEATPLAWNWSPNLVWAASFSAALLLCLVLMQQPSSFLYFQF